MKQKQLLKTLLAAVCLLVGTNAWGDDVYTEVYQRTSVEGTNQWASADVTDWGSVTDLAINASNYFGFANTASAARDASYTISAIEKNAKVKYVVEWYVQSTNGGYGVMYSYLKLGNLFIRVTDDWKNNDIGFSTDAGATYCSDLKTKETESWVRSGNLVTVTAILNTANNVVESMTVVMDGTTYTTTNLTTTSLSGANNKVIGLGNTSTRSGRSASLIKSITVSQCQQAVTEADYTINYQLNGTTVKTVAGTSVVGATITADVAVDATAEGYIGNHYLTIADEAPSITLTAGENVLNVPVRAPRTATVKVTKTVDGVAQTPAETIFTETDGKVCAWNYFYSMYVKDGENYYKADDVSKFGESGEFTENGQVIERTVAYVLDADAKIFVEAESANTNSSNNINYSGGKTGYVTGGNSYSLGTLPAGIYNLSVYLQDNGNRGIYLRSGSTTGTEIINLGTDKNSSAGVYNKNFTLTEETSLYVTGYTSNNTVNQCANIDYILVKAVPPVSATIGTYGYATFSSTNAVNVDVNGLEAYIVTGKNGSSITTKKITGDVAANTGLILKGNAGTYSLPVVTSSGTTYNKSSNPQNYLFACNGSFETVNAATTGTNYVLTVQEEKVVFAPIGTTPAPVKAGQAALWLQGESGPAKALALSFGDDVTGIEAVSTVEPQGAKTYYNLQGQRVSEPKQGIYVVDGKKVLVK